MNKDEIFKRTEYRAYISGPDWDADPEYIGSDLEEAKSVFEGLSIGDLPERYQDNPGFSAILEKADYEYKFIKELDPEYETIEDYPLEDYHADQYVYQLINDPESKIIDSKNLERVNEKTDDILSEVHSHYGGKYTTIDLDEEGKKQLKLRIADHSGKHKNKGSEDYFLSIVIVEKNPTKHFKTAGPEGLSSDEEFEFDSDYTATEIIEFIDSKIAEFKEEVMDNEPVKQTDDEILADIQNKIRQSCTEAKYLHLCQRMTTEAGFAYVVNRCVQTMAKDKLHLSTVLANLEAEEEGIN